MLEDSSALSRVLGYCKGLVPALIPLLVARKDSPPTGPPGSPLSARRELLLRVIRKKPGIRVVVLMKLADMGFGSIYHHLRKLESEGLVFSVKESDGTRRVYPVGAAVPESEPSPLDTETARKLARAVLEKPGLNSAELAAKADCSQRMAQLILRRLVDAGLVARHVEGREKTYTPAAMLADALRKASKKRPK